MSSDPRQRYSRMTRDQLEEVAVSLHRERDDDRQHRAAIKRDLARATVMQSMSLKEIDAQMGAPVLRDLIWVLADVIEACDPLTSPPAEDTMRTSNPSSSRDEGAPTRKFRRLKRTARYRVERVTESLRADLERDEVSDDLSFIRRQARLVGWHRAGKHNVEPEPDCPDCAA